MTTPVQDDFAAFVVARWPDLEALALVALLDDALAREATTRALATLRTRWSDTLEEGSPTTAARRELLARVAAAPSPGGHHGAHLGTTTGPEDGDGSAVPAALLDALAHETPTVRAALVAPGLWDLTPPELAALQPRTGPTAADVAAARARLLAAHREAQVRDGHSPADHLLDDDLAALADDLVHTRADPPDPATLVAERARRVRRRHVVVGAGAAAVVGLAGWWVGQDVLDAPPDPAPPTSAPPSGGVWASTSTWPARGTLASDTGMQALVARAAPDSRLVYADDVQDVRVVVAANGDRARPESTEVHVWAGSVGAPAEQLLEIPYVFSSILGSEDVIAVGVPHPTGGVFLALAAPDVRSARFSPVVRPLPDGTVDRRFLEVVLDGGVGDALLADHWGNGGLVRCGDYTGSVLLPLAWVGQPGEPSDDVLGRLLADVSSLTGYGEPTLEGEVLVDSATGGSVLDPVALSPSGGDGRAVLASVTLPNDAVVRSVEVTDDGRTSGPQVLSISPLVLPADQRRAPMVLRVGDERPGTARFLVIVPEGGATCQLLATSPNAYPVSKVVEMKGDTAIVPVVNADQAGGFRLVVKDAEGDVTFDGPWPAGRDLRSDGPDDAAALGLEPPTAT